MNSIDKFILSEVALQTADNGDTSYWGGTFKLTLNEDELHSSGGEFYFRGSDRENSPEQCIMEQMERLALGEDETFGEENHDRLYSALEEFMGEESGKKLMIGFDHRTRTLNFDLI